MRSAFTNSTQSPSLGRNSRAKVVFPAPFGPAMMKQLGIRGNSTITPNHVSRHESKFPLDARPPHGKLSAMNIAKMMKQAQQMQAKMQKMQEELAEQTVEASVGGGKVRVEATCAGDVNSIKIDPAVVDPEDVEMLEDLVLSGVKQAIEKGKAVAAEEMKSATAGMGLPPGMGF